MSSGARSRAMTRPMMPAPPKTTICMEVLPWLRWKSACERDPSGLELIRHPGQTELVELGARRCPGRHLPARHLVIDVLGLFDLFGGHKNAVALAPDESLLNLLGECVGCAVDALAGVVRPQHIEA